MLITWIFACGFLFSLLALAVSQILLRRKTLECASLKLKEGLMGDKILGLQLENQSLQVRLEERDQHYQNQVSQLKDLQVQLQSQFEAVAGDSLRKNAEQFLQMAETRLESFSQKNKLEFEIRQHGIKEILNPLKDSLTKVDQKINELEQARAGAYEGLKEQMTSLQAGHSRLNKETSNLVAALKSPNTRGRWGEMQLRRVVEMAGMLDHCDFHEQSTGGDPGQRLRPDLLVRLPAGRQIVVDAKTPLHSYLEAIDTQDEGIRDLKMREHAGSLRRHIQALGQKAYWEQFQPSPDFVILFLPGEPIFSAALEVDPSLIEYGVDSSVILATPTTLISLLRAVAYGWRQESLADNAMEIASLGQTLYERIADLSVHFKDLGTKLDASVKAYNSTLGTLDTRVFPSARRMMKIAPRASSKEVLAAPFIDRPVRMQNPVNSFVAKREVELPE